MTSMTHDEPSSIQTRQSLLNRPPPGAETAQLPIVGRARQLLPTLALLIAGCASTPATKLTADSPGESAQIQARLDQIFDAGKKKDFGRMESYHLYGPGFTKFPINGTPRQDAEDARKAEHDGLSAVTNLTMQADDLKIDVFGGVGIATFVIYYGFTTTAGAVAKRERSSLVFVKDQGEWKIAHEHFSPIKADP
jgi:ketosteroid isomerase-like protein